MDLLVLCDVIPDDLNLPNRNKQNVIAASEDGDVGIMGNRMSGVHRRQKHYGLSADAATLGALIL